VNEYHAHILIKSSPGANPLFPGSKSHGNSYLHVVDDCKRFNPDSPSLFTYL
jgi:hypothetical protein